MRLFDFKDLIFLSLDLDCLADDFKFAPFSIHHVLGLVVIELFLPQVRCVYTRNGETPGNVIGATCTEAWNAR